MLLMWATDASDAAAYRAVGSLEDRNAEGMQEGRRDAEGGVLV